MNGKYIKSQVLRNPSGYDAIQRTQDWGETTSGLDAYITEGIPLATLHPPEDRDDPHGDTMVTKSLRLPWHPTQYGKDFTTVGVGEMPFNPPPRESIKYLMEVVDPAFLLQHESLSPMNALKLPYYVPYRNYLARGCFPYYDWYNFPQSFAKHGVQCLSKAEFMFKWLRDEGTSELGTRWGVHADDPVTQSRRSQAAMDNWNSVHDKPWDSHRYEVVELESPTEKDPHFEAQDTILVRPSMLLTLGRWTSERIRHSRMNGARMTKKERKAFEARNCCKRCGYPPNPLYPSIDLFRRWFADGFTDHKHDPSESEKAYRVLNKRFQELPEFHLRFERQVDGTYRWANHGELTKIGYWIDPEKFKGVTGTTDFTSDPRKVTGMDGSKKSHWFNRKVSPDGDVTWHAKDKDDKTPLGCGHDSESNRKRWAEIRTMQDAVSTLRKHLDIWLKGKFRLRTIGSVSHYDHHRHGKWNVEMGKYLLKVGKESPMTSMLLMQKVRKKMSVLDDGLTIPEYWCSAKQHKKEADWSLAKHNTAKLPEYVAGDWGKKKLPYGDGTRRHWRGSLSAKEWKPFAEAMRTKPKDKIGGWSDPCRIKGHFSKVESMSDDETLDCMLPTLVVLENQHGVSLLVGGGTVTESHGLRDSRIGYSNEVPSTIGMVRVRVSEVKAVVNMGKVVKPALECVGDGNMNAYGKHVCRYMKSDNPMAPDWVLYSSDNLQWTGSVNHERGVQGYVGLSKRFHRKHRYKFHPSDCLVPAIGCLKFPTPLLNSSKDVFYKLQRGEIWHWINTAEAAVKYDYFPMAWSRVIDLYWFSKSFGLLSQFRRDFPNDMLENFCLSHKYSGSARCLIECPNWLASY